MATTAKHRGRRLRTTGRITAQPRCISGPLWPDVLLLVSAMSVPVTSSGEASTWGTSTTSAPSASSMRARCGLLPPACLCVLAV